jgi:TPR repeat protein
MKFGNGTLDEAIAAYEADDYDHSFKLFETIARRDNDAEALFFLGRHYIDGLGVEKSKENAMSVWKKASRRGSLDAQYAMLEIVQTTTACCKG